MGLDAMSALVLLTSVYYGAMYGGRISSILLGIPGDEPAMMTVLDGYPMAKQGKAGDALVISGVASFVGAFLATVGLMLLAPLLSRVAYHFGPAEYFALYLLAFCTLGGVGSNNQAKSALAALIGLAIAMIGLDQTTGMPRFTYGEMHLMDGIDFLVAIVGLFAVSEVFFFIESHGKNSAIGVVLGKVTIPWRELKRSSGAMLRGTGIGFVAGVLPGAGGLLFLPYLTGERLGQGASSRGAFLGLTAHHGPAHLHRAVMEGVILAMNEAFAPILAQTGRPEAIISAAGGARSDLWLSIKADVFGCPVIAPEEPEAGLIGAACLGFAGLEYFPDSTAAAQALVRYRPPVQPDPARHARYQTLSAAFREIRRHMPHINSALSLLS